MTVMLAQHRDSIGPMARVISSPTLTQSRDAQDIDQTLT